MTTPMRESAALAVRVFVTVLVVVVLLLLHAPRGSAHAWNFAHNHGRWPNGSDVTFYFRDVFPSGEPRARVIDGFNEWNFAAGTSDTAEPDFYSGGQTTYFGSWNQPCLNDRNVVYWFDLDSEGPTVRGLGAVCPYYVNGQPGGGNTGSVITRFSLSIDNDVSNWYTGTGHPGSSQPDMQSVVTHEAGHVGGWVNHFIYPTDLICPLDGGWENWHTMCDIYQEGWDRGRSLNTHDLHTFDAAYPW